MPEAALVQRVLDDLVAAAKETLGESLRSVVLFGSAAEGRLRASSDVNVIFVLRRFEPERAARFGEALRLAHAAVRLEPMLLLGPEPHRSLDDDAAVEPAPPVGERNLRPPEHGVAA